MTVDHERQATINSAATALRVPAANLAAGADMSTIQAIALDEVKAKGVTKLALATDRQLIRLTADFDVTLNPDDMPLNSSKRELVAKLMPHVIGQVDLFLGAAVAIVMSLNGPFS